jgi:outer membrane receptor protein involved in Fe transport
MKRFYILIAILFSFITANAQFGGAASTTVGKISGTIIDSVTKKPMDYVPISLYRSTGKSPITGVVTDEKGNFHLDGVKPGSYKISIDFMGYASKVVNPVITTDAKPDKALGDIVFSPSAKALKEVVIQGTVPLVENRIDKIVFNAEKDLTSAGGNATDVLQKVPLVAVDINGNVSLRGDGNVRVLINGKPSGATSANLSDVLKTIPADQIKTIEVITSPSAKYEAEGTAGIINIITKQKNVSGFSGGISGGVGTRQNNGNLNLNYSKNRFSLTVNAGGNLTWPQVSTTSFNQTFFNSSNTVTQSTVNTGSTRLKRYGGLGSVTVNYDVNTFNSFTSTIRLNQGGFNSTGFSSNAFTNFVTPSASLLYNGHTVSHNFFGGFDWNADYTHKFKKEGHELSFSTQWSHSVINTDYTNVYSQQSTNSPNQSANNDGTNNEYTLQADYVLPISKVLKLEAGGKTIFRRINSDFNSFKTATSAPGDSTSFIFDPKNSNLYAYNQDVYAGYAVLTITLPKSYTLLVGSRLENTAITGIPTNSSQTTLQPFTQNYDTYIPSLTIQKALTPTQTLKVTYSKRITRPSLTFLNPFLNTSNPNSETQGNPKLSPEIAQTVELNYNTFIGSSIINVSTYYRYISGLIEGIAAPRTDGTSGTLTTYANIGTNKVFGASFFGSITPVKILTIRASINAYTYNPNATGQFTTLQVARLL